jgi:hypothetical protein
MKSLLLAALLLVPALARAAAVCPVGCCPCVGSPRLDDESCYQVPHHNTFHPPIPVVIHDQFGTLTANAINFHRLCAPTNKNGDCPACPTQSDHYLGLELAQIVGTPAQPHLSLSYQFGVISGDIGAPGFLQVPAGKALSKPAPPPPAGLHSYNCYHLDNLGGDRTGHAVTQDQFTAPGTYPMDLDAARGWTVCVGADVDGTDPGAVGISPVYLCNLVDDDPTLLPFNQLTVFANSSLTGQVTATITRYDNLCMPATIQ